MKIRIRYLFEFTLVFLFLQQACYPSQMTFETLLLVIAAGSLLIFMNGKLYYNPFLISYLLLLIFAFFMSLLGYGTGSIYSQIALLFGGWMTSVCIYNYLMKFRDVERFMVIYSIVAVVSMLIIWGLLGPDAVSSRMGHNGSGGIVSYYIAGTPIYKSSNGTANICAMALFFFLYFVEKKKSGKYYIPIAFLLITLLLCGSRKAFLVVVVYLVYYYFLLKKGVTKKKLLIVCIAPIIAYVLLYGVPVIYNSVTIRIESMIMNLFNITNDLDENSYLERMRLQNEALSWISQKPFLGYGFNVFQKAAGNGAENNILQLMLNFGLVGTLIYYSFLPSLLVDMYQNRKKSLLTGFFSVLVLTVLMQDFGTVSYSWQRITMWFSIFYAVVNIQNGKGSCLIWKYRCK